MSTSVSGVPWVEKYRPTSLEDVSHQSEVVHTLQNAVETNRLPHLLFYGPPGTGKTTVALALCRQLWPPETWKKRVLELNASDERGISVVREKIRHFASVKVPESKGSVFSEKNGESPPKKYPNPPFKIIILDEADTVTPDAQAALRRVIESHSKITRFILICNYVTRIISPLASRCAKFRFQSLPPESMRARLEYIADQEHCFEKDGTQGQAAKDQVLSDILNLSGGDMRRAVTTLQSAHSLGGSGRIGSDDIAELSGLPPSKLLDDLFQSLHSSSFETMNTMVQEVLAQGHSAQFVLQALSQKIITSPRISEFDKANMSIRIAEADKDMVGGADEGLQLLHVCSRAVRCFPKKQLQ